MQYLVSSYCLPFTHNHFTQLTILNRFSANYTSRKLFGQDLKKDRG
jgi:hypothetical protein